MVEIKPIYLVLRLVVPSVIMKILTILNDLLFEIFFFLKQNSYHVLTAGMMVDCDLMSNRICYFEEHKPPSW